MIFKTVPKAKEYEMSISGEIRRKDGLPCTVSVINEQLMVTLVIYGKEKTVALEWLRLMTHFEVDLNRKDFWNVSFTPLRIWKKVNTTHCGMVFNGPNKPIYKPGYRIIPNFTRYAISAFGNLIDTYTGGDIQIYRSRNSYLLCTIYNPDKNKNTNVVLHRLVALAWVRNPDHLKYYLVNHKNGDKHDPTSTNLEWTDHKGNTDHAFATGLRSDNLKCKIRDTETKEVAEFPTIAKACESMGVSPRRVNGFNFKRPVKLIKDRYELKLVGDDTPWIYESVDTKLCPGRYQISVTYPNGSLETFHDVRTLKRKLNIEITTNASVYKIVDRAKILNPGMEIVIFDTYQSIPIQAYHVLTGNVIEANSIPNMAKILGLHRGGIKTALEAGETRIFKSYAFRYKSKKKWDTQWTESINRSECILAININGSITECKSLREAELLTKVNRKAIRRALHGGTINTNWFFKYK